MKNRSGRTTGNGIGIGGVWKSHKGLCCKEKPEWEFERW